MSNDIKPFDPVQAKLAEFSATATVEVKDDQTMSLALSKARDAKVLINNIEAIRVSLVKPYNDKVKEINAHAKLLAAMVDKPLEFNKKQLIAYEKVKELERQAELKKAEEARLKAEADAKRDAEIDGMFGGTEAIHAEIMQEVKVTEIKTAHSAQVANIEQNKVRGSRKVWTFDINNPLQVPRDFLIVDESAIRKAVAAGVREIPGVNIYQDTRIAIV